MKKLLIAALLSASFTVGAQVQGTAPAFIEGGTAYTWDSDKTSTHTVYAGAVNDNGFGARAGIHKFRTPAYSKTGESAQFKYVKLDRSNTLVDVNVGVKQLEKTTPYVDINVFHKLSDKATISGILVSDVVETEKSVKNGINFTTALADVGYNITDRLNFSFIGGASQFSDGNTRAIIRTKTSYAIVPEHGVSVYFRTRDHFDSKPESPNYFSPKQLSQQVMGAQIRKSFGSVQVYTFFDVGNETLYRETTTSSPIYTAGATVQSTPWTRGGTTFGATAIRTSSSASSSLVGGDGYNWNGVYAWVKIPF